MISLDTAFVAELKTHLSRVVIFDDDPLRARQLADMIRQFGANDIYVQTDHYFTLSVVRDLNPGLILCAFEGKNLNGIAFTKALRRSKMAAKKVPVIMLKAKITPSELTEARNAGVHELLLQPFSLQDMGRRLKAVFQKSRLWIDAEAYVGPDRRRFNSGDFRPLRKRRQDDSLRLNTPVDHAVMRIHASLEELITKPREILETLRQDMLTVAVGLKDSSDPRLLGTLSALMIELKNPEAVYDRLRPMVNEIMQRLDLEHSHNTENTLISANKMPAESDVNALIL